jgi:hypothetical protein
MRYQTEYGPNEARLDDGTFDGQDVQAVCITTPNPTWPYDWAVKLKSGAMLPVSETVARDVVRDVWGADFDKLKKSHEWIVPASVEEWKARDRQKAPELRGWIPFECAGAVAVGEHAVAVGTVVEVYSTWLPDRYAFVPGEEGNARIIRREGATYYAEWL